MKLESIVNGSEVFYGYIVRRMEEFDGPSRTPISTALKAQGTLWYGNQRPTVIFSSLIIIKQILFALKKDQVIPAVYRGLGQISLGFNFNGSIWTDHDACAGRIVMLNENMPDDPRFNGYYIVGPEVLI